MKIKRLYPRDLHPCPWCQQQPVVTPLYLGPGCTVFNIACDKCSVVMAGDEGVSRSEMIRRWNERSPKRPLSLRSEQ